MTTIPPSKGEGKGWHRDHIPHSLAKKFGSAGGTSTKNKHKIIVDVGSSSFPVKNATHAFDMNVTKEMALDENPKEARRIKKIKWYNEFFGASPHADKDISKEGSWVRLRNKADEIHANHALYWGQPRKDVFKAMHKVVKPGGRIYIEDYTHKETDGSPITPEYIRNQAKRHNLKVENISKRPWVGASGCHHNDLKVVLSKPYPKRKIDEEKLAHRKFRETFKD